MSKKGGGSQTTDTSPWTGLQPYLSGEGGTNGTDGYWETTGEGEYAEQIWNPAVAGTNATTGVLPEAQRLYEQGAQSYYPGQTYAGFDPSQTQGQNSALNFAQGGMQNTANSALGANQLMTSGDLLRAESNPYLRQNVTDANNLIGRDFRENAMPAIGNQAVNTGQYGSSRQGIAEGIASRGMGEAIQRNTNQMYNNAYNNGLNMMATGVGQTNQAMAGGLAPSQVMQDTGALRQQQDQLGINDAVNAYNFNQNADWDNLGKYQGILGGNFMGSGGSQTVPVTGSNPLMGALGGAVAGSTFGPVGAGVGGVIGLLG